MWKKVISIIVLIIFTTGCSNNIQHTGSVSTTKIVNEEENNHIDLYYPVVNAYFALEHSSYTTNDKNILGDNICLTPNDGGSYFIGYDTKPILMYTFYDLNGNGNPELLIGAELGVKDDTARSSVFITGIYGLRNGRPVSLLQVGTWDQLSFSIDVSGNCIIKMTSGIHIDYVVENFYKVDETETLITLDKLYTYGKINDLNKPDDITYNHMKDVKGEEASISEQEYLELMQGYGAVGHFNTTDDSTANEMIINSWNPIAEYR